MCASTASLFVAYLLDGTTSIDTEVRRTTSRSVQVFLQASALYSAEQPSDLYIVDLRCDGHCNLECVDRS